VARIKNVEAFCSFCNTITKMELAGEAATNGDTNKRWAKCKKCKQMIMINLDVDVKDNKPSLEGIENEDCKIYSPDKTFEIGEPIYHQDWDDFGRVVSKDVLSNGQRSISVEFQKLGTKKLIEKLQS